MFLQADDSERSRRKFTRRALLFGGVQALGFGVLTSRLYQLQVMERGVYVPIAERNRVSEYGLAALRGQIVDRRGLVLAKTHETFRCYLTPSLAGDVSDVLASLAEIIDFGDGERARLEARLKRHPSKLPLLVADDLSWQQAAQASIHAPWLPGVDIELGGRRTYHGGTSMGHVVGYIGAVERFALDDKPALRLAGAKIGKTGVERGMEEALAGHSGLVRREADAHGKIVSQLSRVEPQHGEHVVLSIDKTLQDLLLSRLHSYRRAAAVVVDCLQGDVLAMVSSPAFDFARMAGPMSQSEWQRLRETRDEPMLNRAAQGHYPPGSTFKMVTALAALEAGVLDPRDQINCRGAIKVANHKFRCWNRGGHGPCDLHRALRESCDVYFYEISRRVGINRIAEMAHKLGLGQTYDNGFAGQGSGLIPDADWKLARFGRGWYTGETLLAAIGQGYVQATPLQMAVMTARLATGKAIVPHLARIYGSPVAPGVQALDVNRDHLELVRRAMAAVVNEPSGTGTKARLDSGHVAMLGKTGTSQVARMSSRLGRSTLPWHLRDHALFVGFVEDQRLEQPLFALSVIVEHGGSGGQTAAPLARLLARDVLAAAAGGQGRSDHWQMVSGAGLARRRDG